MHPNRESLHRRCQNWHGTGHSKSVRCCQFYLKILNCRFQDGLWVSTFVFFRSILRRKILLHIDRQSIGGQLLFNFGKKIFLVRLIVSKNFMKSCGFAGKTWLSSTFSSTLPSSPNNRKVNFTDLLKFCVNTVLLKNETVLKLKWISANTGGLLSLCMGFSFLSLMEVFYYIVIRVPCQAAQKRHQKSKQKLARKGNVVPIFLK